MNRSELASAVAESTGLTQSVVNQVLDGVDAELVRQVSAGTSVNWSGLFTLDVVQRSERSGRNPQTGKPLTIPARPQTRLRVGSRLKKASQSSS